MDINKVKLGEGKIFNLKYITSRNSRDWYFRVLDWEQGIRQAFCFAFRWLRKHPVPIQAQDNYGSGCYYCHLIGEESGTINLQ